MRNKSEHCALFYLDHKGLQSQHAIHVVMMSTGTLSSRSVRVITGLGTVCKFLDCSSGIGVSTALPVSVPNCLSHVFNIASAPCCMSVSSIVPGRTVQSLEGSVNLIHHIWILSTRTVVQHHIDFCLDLCCILPVFFLSEVPSIPLAGFRCHIRQSTRFVFSYSAMYDLSASVHLRYLTKPPCCINPYLTVRGLIKSFHAAFIALTSGVEPVQTVGRVVVVVTELMVNGVDVFLDLFTAQQMTTKMTITSSVVNTPFQLSIFSSSSMLHCCTFTWIRPIYDLQSPILQWLECFSCTCSFTFPSDHSQSTISQELAYWT